MTGASVLMVEPNPGILIVARNVLARAGYGVLAVSNARQGVKLCEQRAIEVLLLDAKQASSEVMSSLRSARHPQLQVILTVQKGRDVMTLEAIENSQGPSICIEDILEKPFTPERLLSAVDHALDRVNASSRPDAALINVDAMPFEEETNHSEKTDIFPFATLLQRDTSPEESGVPSAAPTSPFDDDETRVAIGLDGPGAQRAARVRAALEDEAISTDAKLISACVRACERVLQAEKTSPLDDLQSPTSSILVLTGYVGHLSIDQILQLPSAVDGPSRCRLEQNGGSVDLFYKGSSVVFGRQNNLPGGFTLGRLLVARGLVRNRDVEAVLDPRHGLSGPLGERLVQQGLLSQEGVQDALRRQTEELVYEVVRWREGRFSVFASESLPIEATRAQLAIPVQHLLLEGMRRLDEWHRIEGEVGDMRAVLRPLAGTQEAVRALSPADRMVFDKVQGSRTVAELVQNVARPSFEVFRALHHLTHQNLVSVGS